MAAETLRQVTRRSALTASEVEHAHRVLQPEAEARAPAEATASDGGMSRAVARSGHRQFQMTAGTSEEAHRTAHDCLTVGGIAHERTRQHYIHKPMRLISKACVRGGTVSSATTRSHTLRARAMVYYNGAVFN